MDIDGGQSEDHFSCSVLSTYAGERFKSRKMFHVKRGIKSKRSFFTFSGPSNFSPLTSWTTVQLKIELWPEAALFTKVTATVSCLANLVKPPSAAHEQTPVLRCKKNKTFLFITIKQRLTKHHSCHRLTFLVSVTLSICLMLEHYSIFCCKHSPKKCLRLLYTGNKNRNYAIIMIIVGYKGPT